MVHPIDHSKLYDSMTCFDNIIRINANQLNRAVINNNVTRLKQKVKHSDLVRGNLLDGRQFRERCEVGHRSHTWKLKAACRLETGVEGEHQRKCGGEVSATIALLAKRYL